MFRNFMDYIDLNDNVYQHYEWVSWLLLAIYIFMQIYFICIKNNTHIYMCITFNLVNFGICGIMELVTVTWLLINKQRIKKSACIFHIIIKKLYSHFCPSKIRSIDLI